MIECVCIDDKNKPNEIPIEKWVKEGEKYHITYIYMMTNQNNIKGCDLSEIDLTGYDPYNCFKLSRFAIQLEDLQAFIELLEMCNDEQSFDANEFVKKLQEKEELILVD